jgi:hypothetical protein
MARVGGPLPKRLAGVESILLGAGVGAVVSAAVGWLRHALNQQGPADPPVAPVAPLANPVEINAPLLIDRAQAQLLEEERRGDAMLDRLATIGASAGVAMTLGGTVLVALLPRDLPFHQHVLWTHLGTILAWGFGVLGFGCLLYASFALGAQRDPRFRGRTPSRVIDIYPAQLANPTDAVARLELGYMALQERILMTANARRALLVARVSRAFLAGFLLIVLFAIVLLIGSRPPTDVRFIGNPKPGPTFVVRSH